MTKRVSVKIDGLMVLVMVALVLTAYVWWNRGKVADAANKVNPLNPDNVINQTYENVLGKETAWKVTDYVGGALSLLNPWASETSKMYARQVYGLDKGAGEPVVTGSPDSDVVRDQNQEGQGKY